MPVSTPRYAVGIDLGTTNSALAYVDLALPPSRRELTVMPIPQLVRPGELGERPTLPSFLYLPGEHELPPGATALPWDATATVLVGEGARKQGAEVPGRVIASAKSWLCHPAVDRQAAILPWGAPSEVPRRSPIEVSAAYLSHLAGAFAQRTGTPLAEADVVLTVPASFDEVARELTLEAARRAGLSPMLLEEPQAAFYALMEAGRLPVAAGESVLVCDIGGGTTDFSIISCLAEADGGDGSPRFERTAVGDHLLLGGDNMDLALARLVERRVVAQRAEKLDAGRFQLLAQACRTAKEKLLAAGEPGAAPPDQWSVHVAGRGRGLIGGGLRAELTRADVEATLLDGFFPSVDATSEPARASAAGLREFGLPYVADAAITRHLAAFLRRHRAAPDTLLCNGGVLRAPAIRERLVAALATSGNKAPRLIDNPWPDLAVARGAAYYAVARLGERLGAHAAQRIGGGAARAYYVEIDAPGAAGETRVEEGALTALCLTERGAQPGERVEVRSGSPESGARDFEVLTNRPVRFRLLSSSSREDRAGDVLTLSRDERDELAPLPPIVTVLRHPRTSQDLSLKVRLLVEPTELGTLDVHLESPNGLRFKLAFDLRGSEKTLEEPEAQRDRPSPDRSEAPEPPSVPPERIAAAEELVRRVFDKAHAEPLPPAQAMKALQSALGLDKGVWPLPVLRALWEPLKALRGQRGRTAEHEARWLNLVGYCLRPGYGYPLDDWRVKEAWRLFNAGIVNDKDARCRLEWWILWRRCSGGLTRTMQEELQKRIFPLLLPEEKKRPDRKPPPAQEAAEMYRVAGSLERITAMQKWKLGEVLLKEIEQAAKKHTPQENAVAEPKIFALGRLGARVPLYGPIENVISKQRAERWLERLLSLEWATDSSRLGHNSLAFAAAELARLSGDRARDLDEPIRQKTANRLRQAEGGTHLARLVLEVASLESGEERHAFGEALPAGLRLSSIEGRGEE